MSSNETFEDLEAIFMTCPNDGERFLNGINLLKKDPHRAFALLPRIKESDYHLDRDLYNQELKEGNSPNVCLQPLISNYEWSAIATAAKNYVVDQARNSGKTLNIQEIESKMATLDIHTIHDQAMAIYRHEGGGKCPTKIR